MTAFQKFSMLKKRERFKAWIISIAKNKCNDLYRRRYSVETISLDEALENQLMQNRCGYIENSAVSETLDLLRESDQQLLKLY